MYQNFNKIYRAAIYVAQQIKVPISRTKTSNYNLSF